MRNNVRTVNCNSLVKQETVYEEVQWGLENISLENHAYFSQIIFPNYYHLLNHFFFLKVFVIYNYGTNSHIFQFHSLC